MSDLPTEATFATLNPAFVPAPEPPEPDTPPEEAPPEPRRARTMRRRERQAD